MGDFALLSTLRPRSPCRRLISRSGRSPRAGSGANLVEIYRGGYPLEQRAGWSAESTAALHRAIHERDMTVHWFPHRLDSYAPPREDEISHVSDGAQDSRNTFPARSRRCAVWGASSRMLCVCRPMNCSTAWGPSSGPRCLHRCFQKCMGPYNPALYFYKPTTTRSTRLCRTRSTSVLPTAPAATIRPPAITNCARRSGSATGCSSGKPGGVPRHCSQETPSGGWAGRIGS